jgi:hypothetical protein
VVTTARPFDFETDGDSLTFTAFAGDGQAGEDSGIYTIPIKDVAVEVTVVDFQDTYFGDNNAWPLPVGYAGFNWSSSYAPSYGGPASDVVPYGGNVGGYNIASGNAIGWNAFGAKYFEISHINGNFDLISVDLINYGDPYGANQLLITAYDDTVQEQQIVVDLTQTLTTFTLNWNDIDTIKIETTGGILSGGSGWWGMDNFTIG